MKAKWFSENLSGIKVAREGINVLTLPVLIIHGTEDPLVPFSASKFLNDVIMSTDKTFEVMAEEPLNKEHYGTGHYFERLSSSGLK